MRASEFVVERQLEEGPIDFARKMAAGVKSFVGGSGFKSGYASKRGEIQKTKDVKTNTRLDMQYWGGYKSSLGRAPTPADAVAWAKQHYKDTVMPPTNMPFKVNTVPVSGNDSDVAKWINGLYNTNYRDAVHYAPPAPPAQPPEPELSFDTTSPPPNGATISSTIGDFTYSDTLNKWVDPAGTPVDNPAIEQKLNTRWQQESSIQAATPYPRANKTVNTTKGQYFYNVNLNKWFQDTDKSGRKLIPRPEVTDVKDIDALNKIAAQRRV